MRVLQPQVIPNPTTRDSPQKEMMWLLSSCTNFLVTASSMICFTCRTEVPLEKLGDFTPRPE